MLTQTDSRRHTIKSDGEVERRKIEFKNTYALFLHTHHGHPKQLVVCVLSLLSLYQILKPLNSHDFAVSIEARRERRGTLIDEYMLFSVYYISNCISVAVQRSADQNSNIFRWII